MKTGVLIVVLISHSVDKTFTDESGNEFNQIIPTLPNKARIICSRLTDIIGYSRAVEGESGIEMKLFLRGTPRFMAGSRFRHIPNVIDFNYQSLVNAISEAVDKEMAELGDDTLFTDDRGDNLYKETAKKADFDEVVAEFNKITSEMMEKNSEYFGPRIVEIVENSLGKGKRVSECTRDQAEIIDLIVYELKEIK